MVISVLSVLAQFDILIWAVKKSFLKSPGEIFLPSDWSYAGGCSCRRAGRFYLVTSALSLTASSVMWGWEPPAKMIDRREEGGRPLSTAAARRQVNWNNPVFTRDLWWRFWTEELQTFNNRRISLFRQIIDQTISYFIKLILIVDTK